MWRIASFLPPAATLNWELYMQQNTRDNLLSLQLIQSRSVTHAWRYFSAFLLEKRCCHLRACFRAILTSAMVGLDRGLAVGRSGIQMLRSNGCDLLFQDQVIVLIQLKCSMVDLHSLQCKHLELAEQAICKPAHTNTP